MKTNFNTYQTESRIYLSLDARMEPQDKQTFFESNCLQDGKELKGFGFTKYGCLLGVILSLFGYAFKTFTEDGKAVYINTNSFCKGIMRYRTISSGFAQQPENEHFKNNNFYDCKLQKGSLAQIRSIFAEVLKNKKGKVDLGTFYREVFSLSQREVQYVKFTVLSEKGTSCGWDSRLTDYEPTEV